MKVLYLIPAITRVALFVTEDLLLMRPKLEEMLKHASYNISKLLVNVGILAFNETRFCARRLGSWGIRPVGFWCSLALLRRSCYENDDIVDLSAYRTFISMVRSLQHQQALPLYKAYHLITCFHLWIWDKSMDCRWHRSQPSWRFRVHNLPHQTLNH